MSMAQTKERPFSDPSFHTTSPPLIPLQGEISLNGTAKPTPAKLTITNVKAGNSYIQVSPPLPKLNLLHLAPSNPSSTVLHHISLSSLSGHRRRPDPQLHISLSSLSGHRRRPDPQLQPSCGLTFALCLPLLSGPQPLSDRLPLLPERRPYLPRHLHRCQGTRAHLA